MVVIPLPVALLPDDKFVVLSDSAILGSVKVVEEINLFERGAFPQSAEWKKACQDVREAIEATDWPHGSGSFTIYPERAKNKKPGNGVVPIKYPCVKYLEDHGWQAENLPEIIDGILGTGDLDAVYYADGGRIAFEWETGNISSAHRAINKLLMALKFGGIQGGILVLPSNKLKIWLTDRISNIGELRPYFHLWDDVKLHQDSAVLRIVVAEHDAESFDVPRIPKGQDGNALKAKVKRVSRDALLKRKKFSKPPPDPS